MAKLSKAIEAYKSISNAADLKREKLSLSDYNDLRYTLQSIIDIGQATTILASVANWCKRRGLKIDEESCCYNIKAA